MRLPKDNLEYSTSLANIAAERNRETTLRFQNNSLFGNCFFIVYSTV